MRRALFQAPFASLASLALLALALGKLTYSYAHDSDLPSLGRSELDHLIELNDGVIPYPFKNLVSLVRAHTLGEQSGVFIPHGRSLQRFDTDFSAPGVLLGHSEAFIGNAHSNRTPSSILDLLNSFPSARTFLGYSPKINTVEVLSYNDSLGRYEVQLIKNYGPGLKPQLEYTSRSLCFSCHQNEGPIFSDFKWSETDRNDHIAKHLNGVETHGLRDSETFIYSKEATGKGDHNADTMDRASEIGQRIINFQKAWIEGCGHDPVKGVECRKLYLELLLTKDLKSSKSIAKLQRLDDILKTTWPKGGIPLGYQRIDDRDILTSPPEKPLPQRLDPLSKRYIAHLNYKDIDLKSFESSYGESPAAPQFECLKQIKAGHPTLFSPTDLQILKDAAGGEEELKGLLNKPEFAQFFEARTLNRRTFIYEVAHSLGLADVNAWTQREAKMPPPVHDSAPPQLKSMMPSHDARLAHFKTYCAQCHSGRGKDDFNFMNASSDAELIERLQSNPKILERLRWENLPEEKRMPPPKSPLAAALRAETNAHRAEMIGFLEGHSCVADSLSLLLKTQK